MESHFHDPVLKEPLLERLSPRPGGTYVDANLGGGSHTQAILERINDHGTVFGIDLDPSALAEAAERLKKYHGFVPLHGNFAEMAQMLAERGVEHVDGVIFDLGVSSHQLDVTERGFSFRTDAPLDMRFDPTRGAPARDLVNTLSERELEHIIKEYGEERWAAAIARRIAQERMDEPITSTARLADLVRGTIPRKFHPPRIHPATRTFQALRIAVNAELESLERGLRASIGLLAPGGRVGVISYHSLEDRIVKRTFLRSSGSDVDRPPGLPRGFAWQPPPASIKVLTRSPVVPDEAEIARNPRARSARLRAAEKL